MGQGEGGRFEGRVAIVTGASLDPSIGLATATGLAREGARVLINGRRAEPLVAAEAKLHEAGLDVHAMQGDAEDEGFVRELAARAEEELGGIDYVVPTVGGSAKKSIGHTPCDFGPNSTSTSRSCTLAIVPVRCSRSVPDRGVGAPGSSMSSRLMSPRAASISASSFASRSVGVLAG